VVDVAGGADDDVLGGFHHQDSMRWTMLADAWPRVKLRRARQAPTTRTASSWLPEKRGRCFESSSVGGLRWEPLASARELDFSPAETQFNYEGALAPGSARPSAKAHLKN
jgi:hypothetical protein